MFDFEYEVKRKYGDATEVKHKKLKSIYNKGHSSKDTFGKGIYALYVDGKLMKIGRAINGTGIFKRMSQYYRQKDGKLKYINDENRDQIDVFYFILADNKACWAAEKWLQAIAYDLGEDMPWDDEV